VTLESFAAGILPENDRVPVEAHLAQCLACAESLEQLTREELDQLVSDLRTDAALRRPKSAALEGAMRHAEDSEWFSARPELSRVLAAFGQPGLNGALGTFAGFDILEVVGHGSMGVVLKAWDRTLERVVALKVVFPTGATSVEEKSFATRFLEEARALAALQHEHIVAVHHAGTEKGLPYLVMPFHAEGTLAQWLRRTEKLPPSEVARVGGQLARALATTHARGILHRDLKPSNVLLEDGLRRVRLADFSLAQPLARGTSGPHARTVAGTPHYMSPEQARGEATDARSDLFGLGAVLFQMATGKPPYPGASSREVLRAATQCELKPVREIAPDVPSALAAVIDRLLAKRPHDRYESAGEAAAKLEQFADSANRHRHWARRVALAALAACLLLAVSAVALDASGRTSFINAVLCRQTGDTYYLRGRFGTHTRLAEAVAAAAPHDVIEARFSDEQLTDAFRVGGKPLTIRAAKGFAPILVATNNAQPLILVDAPLTLEGLTLWRRGPRVNFPALISVENAPLHLLNCRLIRSGHQGQEVVVWGKLRMAALNEASRLPLMRALLGFEHGSAGYLRNCLVAGTHAAAIAIRSSTNQPTRIDAEHNLFFIDRAVSMRPEGEIRADVRFARNVLVTGALLDLDETEPFAGLTVALKDCLVDRTRGALMRVNQGHDGALLRALDWKETNVVYAGEGAYVISRRRRALESEADWNQYLRLPANSHRLIKPQAFAETCVRSCLTLSAADLDAEAMGSANDGDGNFARGFIGEGKPYEAFRLVPAYREWQKQVRAEAQKWEARRTGSAQR
jgi:hypothetical protein